MDSVRLTSSKVGSLNSHFQNEGETDSANITKANNTAAPSNKSELPAGHPGLGEGGAIEKNLRRASMQISREQPPRAQTLSGPNTERSKPKVLILTGGQGGGHRTPAKAVLEQFDKPEFRDAVDVDFCDAKVTGLKRGKTQDLRYDLTNKSKLLYAMYRKATKEERAPLREQIEQAFKDKGGYDAIYSNHADSYRHAAKHLAPDTPFLFASADPGGNHQKWHMDRLKAKDSKDQYLIPAESRVAEKVRIDPRKTAVKRGVPNERIFCEGPPIRPDFLAECSKSRTVCREEMGLPLEGKMLTMAAGAGEWIDNFVLRIFEVLSSNKLRDVHIPVITGGNEKLIQMLENFKKEKPEVGARLTIYGKCSGAEMARLVKAGDVFAGKGGGSSASEIVAAGTPTVIHEVLSGVEKYNVQFLVEQGLAIDASKGNFVDEVDKLLNDKERRSHMESNYSKHFVPDSAERIARRLVNIAQEHHNAMKKPES